MSVLRKLKNAGLDVLTLGASGQAKGQESALRGQANDLASMKNDLQGQYKDEQSDITSTFDPFTQNAGQDWQAYRNEATKDLSGYEYDPWEDFNASSADKYLDPELDNLVKSATSDIEGSAANRGMLFSGQTGKSIIDNSSQMRSDARKQALDMARQDWSQKRDYGMGAKNQGLNLQNMRTGNLSNLASTGIGSVQGAYNLRSGARDSYNQNLNNLALNKSNLKAQLSSSPSGLSNVMGALPTWLKMAKDSGIIGEKNESN